jgi:F-type H+-transporting ATPase subunit delta
MADSKVANRYASSLLENTLEKNTLDKVYKDLKLLIESFDKSAELRRTIESPVIKPVVKFSILKEIFSKKIDLETINFFQFVIDKNREDVLYLIAQRFINLRNKHLGIVELDVKTAFKLDEVQKQSIKSRFEKALKKTVNLNLETDESIIGGFIAKVGDTVYDASLQHQLDLLKKEFGQGSISLN